MTETILGKDQTEIEIKQKVNVAYLNLTLIYSIDTFLEDKISSKLMITHFKYDFNFGNSFLPAFSNR